MQFLFLYCSRLVQYYVEVRCQFPWCSKRYRWWRGTLLPLGQRPILVFVLSHFFTFPFLAAGFSISREQDDSSIPALIPDFLNFSFCSLEAHAISCFENTFARLAFSGNFAIVCCVSCITFPLFQFSWRKLFPILKP